MTEHDPETGEVQGGLIASLHARNIRLQELVELRQSSLMPTAICAAIVTAQTHAQIVAKGSKNQHYGYKYASAEAIIEETRKAISKAALAVVCVGWHVEPGEPHDRMVVQYLLVHESGEQWLAQPVSTPIIPEKGRPEDKAEATALTYNLGYYLRGLLLLPRVEDGTDVDQRDDSKAAPPKKRGGGSRKPDKIMFGAGKGKSFEEADQGELLTFRAKMNPDDPKWGERNVATIAAIDEELARREDSLATALKVSHGGATTDEVLDGDDIPF